MAELIKALLSERMDRKVRCSNPSLNMWFFSSVKLSMEALVGYISRMNIIMSVLWYE